MYQALYRRYRPKTFDEVLGQDSVVNLLKRQNQQNKVAHAYIFTGTRGTGKTSCAKIMARAVNCLNPQDGNPCNECSNCKKILESRTMDVVEMDAASNRGIDDIRELRDQVIFPPAALKYKVYIIDEAHMITDAGFNALLKIMEEPPSHLIFILATTEIDKIPQTILSRCQIFNFRRISKEDIARSIEKIVRDQERAIDSEAVDIIASKADGALRDAHSILDKVLAFSEGKISKEDVLASLGGADSLDLARLVEAISKENYQESISKARSIIQDSGPVDLLSGLTDYYTKLIIAKASPKNLGAMDQDKYDLLLEISKDFTMEDLADGLETLTTSLAKMKSARQTTALALLTIMRLIRRVDVEDLMSRVKSLELRVEELEEAGPSRPLPSRGLYEREPDQLDGEVPYSQETHSQPGKDKAYMGKSKKGIGEGREDLDKAQAAREDPERKAQSQLESDINQEGSDLHIKEKWSIIVKDLTKARPSWLFWLGEFEPEAFDGEVLTLSIDPEESTKLGKAKANSDQLEEAISRYLSRDIKLSLVKKKKEKKISEEDQLAELFGDRFEVK